MARRPFLLVAALSISSCGSDTLTQSTDEDCQNAERDGKMLDGTAACFADEAVEQVSGFLILYPETSIFTEHRPDSHTPDEEPSRQTWAYDPLGLTDGLQDGVYKVKAKARRSVRVGAFGHHNMFGSAILLDELEQTEFLGALSVDR